MELTVVLQPPPLQGLPHCTSPLSRQQASPGRSRLLGRDALTHTPPHPSLPSIVVGGRQCSLPRPRSLCSPSSLSQVVDSNPVAEAHEPRLPSYLTSRPDLPSPASFLVASWPLPSFDLLSTVPCLGAFSTVAHLVSHLRLASWQYRSFSSSALYFISLPPLPLPIPTTPCLPWPQLLFTSKTRITVPSSTKPLLLAAGRLP